MTDREWEIAKVLDEVFCLFVLANGVNDPMGYNISHKAMKIFREMIADERMITLGLRMFVDSIPAQILNGEG